MIEIGTEVTELTDEHRDGTLWVDIEGDVWQSTPFGWVVLRRRPFFIATEVAHPGPMYGPYRAVVGPPERSQQ